MPWAVLTGAKGEGRQPGPWVRPPARPPGTEQGQLLALQKSGVGGATPPAAQVESQATSHAGWGGPLLRTGTLGSRRSAPPCGRPERVGRGPLGPAAASGAGGPCAGFGVLTDARMASGPPGLGAQRGVRTSPSPGACGGRDLRGRAEGAWTPDPGPRTGDSAVAHALCWPSHARTRPDGQLQGCPQLRDSSTTAVSENK